jgi:hypothetical protein
MTDPLPPELKDLIAAERAAPAPDAAARTAARARLAAAVGHGPPGAAGAFGAGKLLAILAVVVAAGTFAVLHGRGESHARPTAAPVASPTPTPTPTPTAIASTRPNTRDPQQADERSAAKNTKNAKNASPLGALGALGGQSLRSSTPATRSTPSTTSTRSTAEPSPANETPAAPSPPPAEPADAATQAELIRRAWSALAVGEPDRALSIVREDARLHQHGALDEERDAVRIVALARLGRLDEARLAATQFEHDYPTSLHHDLVTRALAGGPDQDR